MLLNCSSEFGGFTVFIMYDPKLSLSVMPTSGFYCVGVAYVKVSL